jgi:hypothetical protein
MPDGDRHSQADEPELLRDRHAIAHRESRNTLRQFDAVAASSIGSNPTGRFVCARSPQFWLLDL